MNQPSSDMLSIILHWKYFLALEQDLIHCSRYVEFSQNNFRSYSVEQSKILLASAAEFEVVSKLLCDSLEQPQKRRNINDIQAILTKHFPKMNEVIIETTEEGLQLQPLICWKTEENSPTWWKAYNSVKHDRSNHYNDANLENTLNSMAALFCVILYGFAHLKKTKILNPEPKFFDIKWYDSGDPAQAYRIFSLPDAV